MRREPELTPQHLARLAVLRCQGQSWDLAAKEMKRPLVLTDGDRLRERLKDNPEWKKVLSQTRRELVFDAMAEGITVLRVKARSQDEILAARAANHLVRIGETVIRHRKKLGPAAPIDPADDFDFERDVSDEEFDALVQTWFRLTGKKPPP
jgi:hypothetical protein